MKAYVGRVRNEAGDDFEEKVVKWFEENSSFVVHPEVPLKVGKALDPGDDLGDIDVLCVDESTNICYSIECKNINSARNAQEMGNEIEKLMEEDSEKSLTAKHLRRHDWLVQNKDKVAEEYGLDKTAVSIVSVFLTSVELPSPFLKTMPLPFIAYSTLNRLGLDHFMSKLT